MSKCLDLGAKPVSRRKKQVTRVMRAFLQAGRRNQSLVPGNYPEACMIHKLMQTLIGIAGGSRLQEAGLFQPLLPRVQKGVARPFQRAQPVVLFSLEALIEMNCIFVYSVCFFELSPYERDFLKSALFTFSLGFRAIFVGALCILYVYVCSETRSQLYRSRCLQVNIHFAAFHFF